VKMLFVSRTGSEEHSSYNHRLLMLYRGIRERGIDADFLYMGDLIRKEPAILSPVKFPAVLQKVRSYDIIHLGTFLAAYPFCVYRKRLKAVLVHDMHGHSSELMMMLRLRPGKLKGAYLLAQSLWLEEITIHGCDYHLVVSRPLRERLLAHGVPQSKTLLLRNGVNTDLFRPTAGDQGDRFTVCYAGDFQVWQGIDLLLSAARRLGDADILWRFVGFRDKPAHHAWKRRIQSTLGGRVELVDRVDQSELRRILGSADLLILPRPYHRATAVAMPTKFAEYIALGKAVVVTEVDETAQFVKRHRCGLVSPPTAAGLAETIERARGCDRENLREMGRRGRRLAEQVFSWDTICDRYVRFLRAM